MRETAVQLGYIADGFHVLTYGFNGDTNDGGNDHVGSVYRARRSDLPAAHHPAEQADFNQMKQPTMKKTHCSPLVTGLLALDDAPLG